MVAYSAQANNYVLWTYQSGAATNSLVGTQGASYPFWSPAVIHRLFADGKLKKSMLRRTDPRAVRCPNGGWHVERDGVIVSRPTHSWLFECLLGEALRLK